MRLNDCDMRPWYEDTDEIKRVSNRIYGAEAFENKEDTKMNITQGVRDELAKNNLCHDIMNKRIPIPKKIIVNEDSEVTVVLWNDGTKTIVRCSEADTYDSYAAYCAAFAKKCYGTNSQLKRTIEKLTVYQDTKVKNRPCLNESLPPDPLNFKY